MREIKNDTIQKLRVAATLGMMALFVTPAVAKDYFYSVDFSSPLNQVGQSPATGAGSLTPSSIVFGTPKVESAFGGLTDQPLVFSAIGYQQIQFNLGEGAANYFVDFDFETHNLNSTLFAFTLLFDTPTVQNFLLNGDSRIINVPPANNPTTLGWSDDVLHHMRIGIDLTESAWTLQLDGEVPATGYFASYSGDIDALRMNLSRLISGPDDPSVQVGIDNVVIGTTVPEPASTSFLCTAGGFLLLRQWRRYTLRIK